MNLTELCSCIPKQIFKDTEAVQMLRQSMETANKVYKTAQIYHGDTEKQQQLIQKVIEEKIMPFDVKHILWKGVYGKSSTTAEYWFFMHGILIFRGIDNTWSILCAKIPKRKLLKLQTT